VCGLFPPASIAKGCCNTGTSNPQVLNASGWTMLLPYLDQAPLYNRYNHSVAASSYTSGAMAGTVMGDPIASGNAVVVRTPLAAFTCPSDSPSLRV